MATHATHQTTCSDCGNDPDAPCAGMSGCHGYHNGCDCEECQRTWDRARRLDLHPTDPRDLRDRDRPAFATEEEVSR